MDKRHSIGHSWHQLASPKRSHTLWGLLAVLTVCAGLLWLKHGTWLATPNAYMLTVSPDGFKNYTTMMWHVRYDSSMVHYEGMNYPFGEHVLFTDNQPIFSSTLQWWNQNIADQTGKTASVMNVSLIVSLLLGCGILFLLFRKLHLPAWYAGLAAVGVLFLSPQYGRFDGHFALSHTWIFPLLLLLLSQYEERYSRRYQSLLIGLLLWMAAQIHFYYFGLCALFLGLYTAFQLLLDSSWHNWRARLSHLTVMVIVPFALLNIWVHWSDFAADRPSNPYGFTDYIGQWEGIFLPYEDFSLYQWIDKNIIPIRRVNGESKAYVGLVVLGFTLWLLFSGFRLFGKSWDEAAHHRVQKRYMRGIFFAALLLLIFACGFPFAIPGMEWMVDYMGPLRQFRGLGRFTWAYYYVASLLAFYGLWNWSIRFQGLREGRAQWLRWAIALVPLLVLGWEAYTFQRLRPVPLSPNIEKPEVAAPTPDHWLNKVDFSPYQALLPLPYYHLGSENIWWEFEYSHYMRVQTTALHTGKPDMGVNMSRTSCSQTVASAQFVLAPGRVPTMLTELPDNRPLALMVHAPAWDEMQRRYPHLIEPATLVYENQDMKILTLYPDSVRTYVRRQNAAIEQDRLSRTLQRQGVWQVSQTDPPLRFQSYDSLTATTQLFQGEGAFTGNMRDTTWLWNGPLPKGRYILNFWMYANQDMGMNHEAKLIQNNLDDGHEIHFRHEGLRFYMKSIVNGWGLFELPFEVYEDNSRLRLFLHKKNTNQDFFLDEVLIRPEGVDAYRRKGEWVVRNNYWYRL